jgi:hypothetical protein
MLYLRRLKNGFKILDVRYRIKEALNSLISCIWHLVSCILFKIQESFFR